MSIRLFEGAKHADAYARSRPRYTAEVFERIIKFCKQKLSHLKLAVDVGCGSGQSTIPLARYFTKVIGTDVSKAQISAAPKDIPNVEFRVGKAEDLSFLANNFVDLVTIAQALHWTDRSVFFSEATRVLKPGGTLAAYGYGLNILDNKEAQQVVDKLYYNTLGKYWDSQRKHVENNYQDFQLPFPGWIRDDTMMIRKDMSVDDFVGYLTTWSSWQEYLKVHPDSQELEDVSCRLKKICSRETGNADKTIKVSWPVFLLMGHKPE